MQGGKGSQKRAWLHRHKLPVPEELLTTELIVDACRRT